uniref:Uncharacterized protein n=1 Tax=Fagus sylvatica TaxID=28930 RepID=A0A2N9J0B9_FAGSY
MGCVGVGIWLVKNLLVKLLASSFQCTRFFDRIQESIFHQYVLKDPFWTSVDGDGRKGWEHSKSSGLSTISNSLDNFDDDDGEQKDEEITSEWQAKAAAYGIFNNVAKPGSKYIDEEDLLRFMKMEEVDNVLPLFEGAAETGKIKRKVFKELFGKFFGKLFSY